MVIQQPVCVLVPGEDPLSLSQPSSVLCVELRPPGLSLGQFGMSAGVTIVQPIFGQSLCKTMGLASDVTRRQELHDPLSLTVARPLFCDVPWVLGEGVLCRCIYWDWGSQLPFDWLCFFCGGLYCKEKFA